MFLSEIFKTAKANGGNIKYGSHIILDMELLNLYTIHKEKKRKKTSNLVN